MTMPPSEVTLETLPTVESRASSAQKRGRGAPDASTAAKDSAPPAKRAKSGPATTDAQVADKEVSATILPSVYAGNFDLYLMKNPSLAKIYVPSGSNPPNYAKLYEAILEYQAKRDFAARVYLKVSTPSESTEPTKGIFEGRSIADPMSDEPFEINIDTCKIVDKLVFKASELSSFPAASAKHMPDGSGLDAKTDLPRNCGITSGTGVFKMKRVWAGTSANGQQELFEGYFSCKVKYSAIYKRKGHGNGEDFNFSFWGVKALRDKDGKEIGLGPKN
ncbi:hypothetical protein BJ138DRAFT_1067862 [Hygrophoropsis aurantiaca]|uniref:Uncharacterized protein n=1 Tax=Hygrophoropsis aurantiaca TaxID=72124 RepID=A0ACB8A6H2_9AGAM|nr:hypothetical protein BJ138DRAFT_1067862 [Hygrophoropsis aurantiaca]